MERTAWGDAIRNNGVLNLDILHDGLAGRPMMPFSFEFLPRLIFQFLVAFFLLRRLSDVFGGFGGSCNNNFFFEKNSQISQRNFSAFSSLSNIFGTKSESGRKNRSISRSNNKPVGFEEERSIMQAATTAASRVTFSRRCI
jgi:hypothetical protein